MTNQETKQNNKNLVLNFDQFKRKQLDKSFAHN